MANDNQQYRLPGPISIALMTGRPELARIGIQSIGRDMTREDMDVLSNYAEAMVREIQAERELTNIMYEQVRGAVSSVKGILNTFDRIEEAFRQMQANAGPDAVAEALRNPTRKERS